MVGYKDGFFGDSSIYENGPSDTSKLTIWRLLNDYNNTYPSTTIMVRLNR